ncbi:hypothetical protein [Streptomyces antimycoticus]|uniref:hypothetical protein n=1 Tax=Streptomyces antimycoticus TaxID=68175 RepID=UPI000A364277|nr:hypothetical protein [Streptomyces antimycoticus]
MVDSRKPVTPTWAALLDLDTNTHARLRDAGSGATRFVQCGDGRDAVVITPLQRGLAALDALRLPVEHGHAVLADHSRQELIVIVEEGWTHLWEEARGVRVLSCGDWLLVPTPGFDGSYAATWLSRPREQAGSSLAGMSAGGVDVRDLYYALNSLDRPVVPPAVTP